MTFATVNRGQTIADRLSTYFEINVPRYSSHYQDDGIDADGHDDGGGCDVKILIA